VFWPLNSCFYCLISILYMYPARTSVPNACCCCRPIALLGLGLLRRERPLVKLKVTHLYCLL
jgi:hypothetical protein